MSKREAEIAELRRRVEASPRDTQCLLRLGDLLQHERRIPEAMECYERAAEIYLAEGLDLRVVAIWSTIVKLDPTRTALRLHLARGYVKLDLMDEAIGELKLAIADYRKKQDSLGERLAQSELDRILRPN